jgi:hypothetical protein
MDRSRLGESIFKLPVFKIVVCLILACATFHTVEADTFHSGKRAALTIELYISPKGNDSNPGTKKLPLKSLEGARQRLRTERKKNLNGAASVLIEDGTYYLEKPVYFSAEDAGSEEFAVSYMAAPGAKPVFTGSKKLTGWKVAGDMPVKKILAPGVSEKVYVADLKAAGITDFGDPTELGLRPELFCNGQLQTLARWPDSGLTTSGLVSGKTALPPTYMAKRGTKEGDFEYLDKRQDRWAKEKDARLGGYWYWDWSEQFQKVDRIDSLTKTIHILPPYHGYGYKDSLHYFGLNLLCELDKPGEWYLDRTKGLLYWYPPMNIMPSKAAVTLSVFAAPFMVEMDGCTNLSINGLSFVEGRGSAVRIKNGKKCLISDCRIERFGQDGIHVENGWDHGISGCFLRNFGCGGIKISGGDRKNLTPSGHYIENSVVEHFSLFKRTYQPAILIEGCGMRISHNRFKFSSSSAFRLEGNDVVIEYNEIRHVVNESDDQGGLDVFYNVSYQGNVVRYNHWSDISGGTLHGAAGVRLDDMISGFRIFGNVFERCGARHFGAVQIHGGKDNLVENNLFYDCPAGVSFSTWKNERWLSELDSPVVKKRIYEEVDIRSAIYLEKYPVLKDIRLNPNVNKVVNNVMVDCKQILKGGGNVQILENNTSIASEGKSIETFCNTEFLKVHGLQPIPFKEIGPKKNKWVGM